MPLSSGSITTPITPEGADILIIDDDPLVVTSLKNILGPQGRLRFATRGAEALTLIQQAVPDLILLDVEMPGLSGFDVCQTLRETPTTCDIPIIFITSHDSAEDEVKGLSLGAVDFIAKPPRPALVRARVQTQLRLKRLSDALRRAASMDGLTGVANRRRLDEVLQAEWKRAKRTGLPVSLLMFDIDHFKAYNDRGGHLAGDDCLRKVAQAFSDLVHRPADLVARYGGEEFVVVLPETSLEGAVEVAKRALSISQTLAIAHPCSPTSEFVTWSIGVAGTVAVDSSKNTGRTTANEVPEPGHDALVAAADRALYAAKREGRARMAVGRLEVDWLTEASKAQHGNTLHMRVSGV